MLGQRGPPVRGKLASPPDHDEFGPNAPGGWRWSRPLLTNNDLHAVWANRGNDVWVGGEYGVSDDIWLVGSDSTIPHHD